MKPIRTEADYEAALARVAELMDAREGTPEGEELDVLADLVEAYEDEHYPIDAPDPVAAIEFRMDQQDAPTPNLKEWLLAPEARTETLTPPRRQLRRRLPPRLTP